MIPTLFLSANAQQSAYWAKQLGFARGEWRHIGSARQVHGLRPESPVFLVGTGSRFVDEALSYLAARGIERVLAEEMVPLPG